MCQEDRSSLHFQLIFPRYRRNHHLETDNAFSRHQTHTDGVYRDRSRPNRTILTKPRMLNPSSLISDVKQIEFKDLSTRGLSYGILHDVLVLVASRYLQVLLIEKALPDSYRDSTTVVRVYETVALALALFIFSPLDLIKIGRQIDIFENPEKPPCPFSSSPIATLLKERKNKGILGLWLNSAAVWKTVCACSSILVLSLTYRGLVGLTERYLLKSQ
eukprot:TRINITY_DN793_c0_g1_i4.p1 TRINITY_DN793_c0_g1~~TRINITY_DN793_c0_g1_i4.p1  ORF type:complete len:217 (-),score=37.11 TRINITY_DN793_c0_g1_i4:38-688(-)